MDREATLRETYALCADVHFLRLVTSENQPILLLYCEGMVDTAHMQKTVLPRLNHALAKGDLRTLPLHQLDDDQETWNERLFAGDLIIFPGESPPFTWDVSNRPQRSTEEANTEVSIKGPRDGFVEDLSVNVALIRKRLRTTSLAYEAFVLGTRSHTKVALLYIMDAAPPDAVNMMRERLLDCRNKKIVNSAVLEQKLSDHTYSLFPLVDYTGRPDYAIYMLMERKILVLVDGSPIGLIAPVALLEQIKSPEDDQYPIIFVWLERILRLGGIFIAIFLPGFWIALAAYNIEEFPIQLLATVTQGRQGLPFSAPMELFGILFIFEFLREAGARLPKTVGHTLALVGALIIGDASIRAGITSPSMLFVGSLTIVASFTLINQSLSGAVTVARVGVFLLSSIVGMYGFIMSILIIVYYLSTLSSLGRPYVLHNSSNFIVTLGKLLFAPLIHIFKSPRQKGGKQ
ncbi:spore germination protein [Brevibacillus panacihumi W25]|uniref:Spore germination protein n=1 Tax=Brevibacillus panacihumi W25 TaxID=1408254 RepID=V6M521_9BACL|nr:spore germination protein [Brevibacillus panacihumi]EST53659.1 spore germination protein [Brevibacillus panacihumi W25]